MNLMANVFKHILICNDILPEEQTEIVEEEATIITPSITEEDLHASYSKGHQEGIKHEQSRLANQFEALERLLETIPEALCKARRDLSSDIANIVFAITSKLFIHQQQHPETLSQQINDMLYQLNDKQQLELLLHPHDLDLLKRGKILLDKHACKNLRLKADEHLLLGGCIIQCEHGVFDAGIERQIENLKQVLLNLRFES
jgi:flagellar assembly protein FliH